MRVNEEERGMIIEQGIGRDIERRRYIVKEEEGK